MLSWIASRLTYANVVATLALFVALGGSSYAVVRIGSDDIADNSVRSKDVRNRTLTGRDVAPDALGGRTIRESGLGRVRRARVADALTDPGAAALRMRCPTGTQLAGGLCFESTARQSSSFLSAVGLCTATNLGNRWLPSYAALQALYATNANIISPGGELTANVSKAENPPGAISVAVIRANGDLDFVDGTVSLPYRCVTTPTNVPSLLGNAP
jgi:hypothetical protein